MSFGNIGAVHFPVNTNSETTGNLFKKDQSRNDHKKIDYKTRKLRHPLRQPDDQQTLIHMAIVAEQDKKKFNKNNQNFIRKNKESLKRIDQVQHTGSTQIKPGTMTLTQKQLTSLLASLGQKADKDSPLQMSTDASNKKVQVKNFEAGESGEVKGITMFKNGGQITQADEKGDKSDSGNSYLFDKTSESGQSQQPEVADSDERKASKTIIEVNHTSEKFQVNLTSNTLDSDWPQQPQLNLVNQKVAVGNIPSMVPWKHMTMGEKKRLQWAREKAEAQDDYNPWGRPGGGAPRHKKQENVKSPNFGESLDDSIRLQNISNDNFDKKQNQDFMTNDIARMENKIREAEDKNFQKEEKMEDKKNEDDYRDIFLNKAKLEIKNNSHKIVEVPIKADSKTQSIKQDDNQNDKFDETEYNKLKHEEKRKWLQELDQQREEQRLAKLAQKERDKLDAGIWTDKYPVDHQKLQHTAEILHNQSVCPWTSNTNTQRTNSAPITTIQDPNMSIVSPPSFLRGQGAFIDPVTRKEQEEKRRIQLEYQAEVKAQIEENKRKMKEERERKIQEDMEEDRKLQMERDFLHQQLEVEQRKNQQREVK